METHEFKNATAKSKFDRIYRAIKKGSSLDYVDGSKPFKVTIKGNKINMTFFAKDIAKEGEPIEKTKSTFTLKETPKPPAKTTTTQALQELPLDVGGKISEAQKAKQKPPTIEEVMDEVKKVLKNIKPTTDLVKAITKIRGLLKEEKNKKSIRAYAFKISIHRLQKIFNSPKLSQKQINDITMAKNRILNWREYFDSQNMMGDKQKHIDLI